MVLHSTPGQNEYSNQTMYNVFVEEHENESDKDTVMTITQTAAIMTAPGSTSMSQGTAISAEVAAATNQLLANQTTMMAQMAVMTMAPPMAPQTRASVPRDAQVAVPMHQLFAAQVGFSTGRGGRCVGCCQGRGRCGDQSRTPFADAMRSIGAVAPPMTNMVPYGGGTRQLPAAPGGQPHRRNAEFSNIYKQHNNNSHTHHVFIQKMESPSGIHTQQCTAAHCGGV